MEYSYYGRLDYSVKPKTTLVQYMIDNFIKNSIEKEIKRIAKEFERLSKVLKTETSKQVVSLTKKVTVLTSTVEELTKKIDNLETDVTTHGEEENGKKIRNDGQSESK